MFWFEGVEWYGEMDGMNCMEWIWNNGCHGSTVNGMNVSGNLFCGELIGCAHHKDASDLVFISRSILKVLSRAVKGANQLDAVKRR